MAYAMQDLGWKLYLINGAWDVLYLAIIYFFFIETKGLQLEQIAVKFEGSGFLYGLGRDQPPIASQDDKLDEVDAATISHTWTNKS